MHNAVAIDLTYNYTKLCLHAETDMTYEDLTQMEDQLPMLYYSRSACVFLFFYHAFTTPTSFYPILYVTVPGKTNHFVIISDFKILAPH